jgi:hypothetical protein
MAAGMEPPTGNRELGFLLVGAWEAYVWLINLQRKIPIRYSERACITSQYLECAVEFLRYMFILARTIRG